MTCTISRYYTLVLRDLNSIMRHDMTTLTIDDVSLRLCAFPLRTYF